MTKLNNGYHDWRAEVRSQLSSRIPTVPVTSISNSPIPSANCSILFEQGGHPMGVIPLAGLKITHVIAYGVPTGQRT